MENYYGRDNLKNSFDDINDFEDAVNISAISKR